MQDVGAKRRDQTVTAAMRLVLSEDLSPHRVALLLLVGLYGRGQVPAGERRAVARVAMRMLENAPMEGADGVVVVPQAMDLVGALGGAGARVTLERLVGALWAVGDVEALEAAVKAVGAVVLAGGVVRAAAPPRRAEGHAATRAEEQAATHAAPGSAPGSAIGALHPASFFGLFVHNTVTSCSLLHFDESLLLYEAFVSYRAGSAALWRQQGGRAPASPGGADGALFARLAAVQAEIGTGRAEACGGAEAAAAGAGAAAEGTAGATGVAAGAGCIAVAQTHLEDLLAGQIRVLEAHAAPPPLLRRVFALMAVPAARIQSAELSLPLCHYVAYLEALRCGDYHGAFSALHRYFDYMVANNSKYFYHFALILRALLHQHFGEDALAMLAIEEAVLVARENKDTATLTYILLWLYNFVRDKPHLRTTSSDHLLLLLVAKAQHVSVPLYAVALQLEAVAALNRGGAGVPQRLLKATYILLHDERGAFVRLAELAVAVWMRMGCGNLGEVYNEVAAAALGALPRAAAPPAEGVAHQSAAPGGAAANGAAASGAAPAAVGVRRAHLLFHRGDTAAALALLSALAPSPPVRFHALCMQTRASLLRGRARVALQIMAVLEHSQPPDLELQHRLVHLAAEVQLALGNHSKALAHIAAHAAEVHEAHLAIGLQYLRCRIFVAAGTPARAVLLVLQQVERLRRTGMVALVAEGVVLLATLLNRMGSVADARRLLRANMVSVWMAQEQQTIAHAYYELAWGWVRGEAPRAGLGQCLRDLNVAIDGFKRLLNLVSLRRCFELELEMAQRQGLAELEAHARQSLDKLVVRAREEKGYGYV